MAVTINGTTGITAPNASLPSITYSGTASSASWTGSGPYTQVVSVSGITSSSTVILDLDLSSVAFADVPDIETAYGLVYRAVPGTNQITLYATDTPADTFSFNATVV